MTATAIIPTMRYRNARRMIDWLGAAFHFRPHMIVDGEGGRIEHAQLVLGKAMIMLGDHRDDDFGALQRPADMGAAVNQSPYVVIADVDAVYASAKAAGADIVVEIHDPEYGGRMFSCRDPEGQLWNFGSYDPWADPA